jgi:divalent metal cation (Fe/Co/Zn/Cd) transporter
MTDVWTSVGGVLGVATMAVTGWNIVDPVIALNVAANIVEPACRYCGARPAG